MKIEFIFAFLLFLFLANFSYAFSDQLVLDKQQCLTCHTSYDGSGQLNHEGKTFAQNLSYKTNAYLQIETPTWLSLGAHAQLLQTFFESRDVKSAKSSLENLNASALFSYEKTHLYFSLQRYVPTDTDVTFKDFVYASDLYLQHQLTGTEDSQSFLKVGRFKPNYGLRIYDNTLASYSEKLQVEVAYMNQNIFFSLSKVFKNYSYNKNSDEDGYLAHLDFIRNKETQFGFGYYRSRRKNQEDVAQESLHLIHQFNAAFSLQTQVDQQHLANNKKGITVFVKPKVRLNQGLFLYSNFEYSNPNLEVSDPKYFAYTIGIDYFHFTQTWLNLAYKNQKNTAINDSDSQMLMASLTFYM